MIGFLQSSLSFIVVLGILVFIHELGHFLAAKSFGIAVPVFSLGFGPRIFGFRRKETDYRVSLLPLGGYVRMAGDEAAETRTGGPEEFLSHPRWQRFVVYVAGAAFNVVFAFLVVWLYFAVYGKLEIPSVPPSVLSVAPGSTAEAAGLARGDQILEIGGKDIATPQAFIDVYRYQVLLAPETEIDLIVQRGEQRLPVKLNTGIDADRGGGDPGWHLSWMRDTPPVIGYVDPGTPADTAGIEAGDRIATINGRSGVDEIEVRAVFEASPDKEVALTIERAGAKIDTVVTPRNEDGRGKIGVRFAEPTERVPLSISEAAVESYRENLRLSATLFYTLKGLVTRRLSMKTLSGPVEIAQVAKQAISSGFDTFLWFLGFISLQLGILNLLPVPVLDGGHVLVLLVESVMRRDLSERVKERVMQAGLVFLLVIFGMVMYQDLSRLFSRLF